MKHSLTMFLLSTVILFASIQIPSAHADTETENTALIRIINILNLLTPLINQAEQAQDKRTRIQFRYDLLRRDVNQIKQGIDQKLNPPTIQPRTVQPINGDYLTMQQKSAP